MKWVMPPDYEEPEDDDGDDGSDVFIVTLSKPMAIVALWLTVNGAIFSLIQFGKLLKWLSA